MTDQSSQEPTMEEILASIRRIISEDDAPAAQASDEADAPKAAVAERSPTQAADETPAHVDEPEDVLELTDRYQEPTAAAFDMAAAPAPEPRPAPAPARAEPIARSGDLDIFDREPIAPTTQPTPVSRAPEPGDDGLLGASAASAAASAFGALTQRVALPADGRTLEDVVRELLRPMLRDWLEQNLPTIVEARVQAEVERISRLNVR